MLEKRVRFMKDLLIKLVVYDYALHTVVVMVAQGDYGNNSSCFDVFLIRIFDGRKILY